MADCLKSNLSVQEPVYYTDERTGEVDTTTAMYSWMHVRAAGPNCLQDTSLVGDTQVKGSITLTGSTDLNNVTIEGTLNGNNVEGTQPSGINEPGSNTPEGPGGWVTPPRTGTELLYDEEPRVTSVKGEASPFTGTGWYQDNNLSIGFIANVVRLPQELQRLPVDRLIYPGGTTFPSAADGTSLVRCRLDLRIVTGLSISPGPLVNQYLRIYNAKGTGGSQTKGANFYLNTGEIIIQPNFNKWAQGNAYGQIVGCSAALQEGLFGTFPGASGYTMPGRLNGYRVRYMGGNSDEFQTGYTPNSEIDGCIVCNFEFVSDGQPSDPTTPLMVNNGQYYMHITVDLDILWSDNEPVNEPWQGGG